MRKRCFALCMAALLLLTPRRGARGLPGERGEYGP